MRRKPGTIIGVEQTILQAASRLNAHGLDEFHGYLLAKEMRDGDQARRLVAHGTLYKALDRLEALGLVMSRWEEPENAAREGRPRRRLYHLTAAGSAACAQLSEPKAQPALVLREKLLPG